MSDGADVEPNPTNSFDERVRQAVRVRFGDIASFETSMNWPAGFLERELINGGLPREMVAERIVALLKCNADWLMTGEGEPYARKAPMPPSEPEPMHRSAQPVDTRLVRTSVRTAKAPGGPTTGVRSERKPAAPDTGSTHNAKSSPTGPPDTGSRAAPARPAEEDPFSVRISGDNFTIPLVSETPPSLLDDDDPTEDAALVTAPSSARPASDAAGNEGAGEPDPFSVTISAEGDAAGDDRTGPVPLNPPKAARSSEGDGFDEFIIASDSPAESDDPRSSRVNMPKFADGSASGSADPTTTDSVLIKAVETDGDADRAMSNAVERQRKLLPDPPPIEGFEFAVVFEPAGGVASEFYDFIQLDDDHLAIVVADVAGKEGLEVWGDTAMSQRSLRIFARATQDPREVLKNVNDELAPDLMAEANLTVVFSVINTKTGEMTTAQSGHQPVLVHNAQHRDEVGLIKPGGMVLGLVSGPRFDDLLEVDTTQLQEGDIVVWYSEGLPSTQNNRGQDFGIDGISMLMQSRSHRPPAEFASSLMRRLKSWRGNGPLTGDVTVIAMRVRELPHPPGTETFGGLP